MRRAVTLAASTLLLTACGVPAQNEAHGVTLPRRALNTASSPVGTPQAGEVAQVLCLVRENRLVQVVRRVDVVPDPQRQLDQLVAGPTETEQAQGLSTALAATALTVARPVAGIADVEVGEGDEGAARSDEVLAYGQIVCTLTSRADVSAVSFRRDGKPLQVPRGDLTLSSQPMRAGDYRTLMGPA